MKKIFALSAILAVSGMMLTGCPKTQEAAQDAANAAGDAAASAGKAVGGAAQGVVNTADKMGAGAMDAVKDAGKAVTGALDTAKIKAAIVADPGLNDPANTINVDVTDKNVFLKGNVKNNDLKKKAGEIAQKSMDEAGSKLELKNMLLVK